MFFKNEKMVRIPANFPLVAWTLQHACEQCWSSGVMLL